MATPLAEFYSVSLGPVPTAPTTNIATWLRNVEQFRRFDVADRNQHVFNARFNYGIGSGAGRQRRPAGERRGVSSVGVWTQRPSANRRPRRWSSTGSRLRPRARTAFYSFQDGGQHQAGIQPNACVIGNFYYFFSDGSVQTNATGVPPPPGRDDGRRDPAGAGGELEIAVRDGLGRQSALSDQPDLGRVAKGSATRSRVWAFTTSWAGS